MTWKIAAGLLGAAVAAGCGNEPLGGGEPTKQPLQVAFVATDLATGMRDQFVSITAEYDVTPEMVSWVAPDVRVASFPGDELVPATQSINDVPSTVTPELVQVPARAEVWERLDTSVDGNGWYAITLPPATTPARYAVTTEWWLFAFSNGTRGVRWSPNHPPVVASLVSCHKDAGVVGVYIRYSEPVDKAAGPPSLDYGTTPGACSVSADAPTETQFICAGEDAQPFSLHIPEGMTAQASGRPMARSTLDSAGMQVSSIPNDTCTIYKPLTVN
jgi:hypothetical protein